MKRRSTRTRRGAASRAADEEQLGMISGYRILGSFLGRLVGRLKGISLTVATRLRHEEDQELDEADANQLSGAPEMDR